VEDHLEKENDRDIDSLKSRVASIKEVPLLLILADFIKVTLRIHQEVKDQNRLLDNMVPSPSPPSSFPANGRL
jgi:hypothetical protein